MNNYMNNTQPFSNGSYFLQPQGNVYVLNSTIEASNIPIGTGFSVALCPQEGVMYVKTLQGTMAYNFSPFEVKKPAEHSDQKNDINAQLADIQNQIAELKKKIDGGKINELL